MDNKKKQPVKKNASGLVWVAVLFLIGILRQVDFSRLSARIRWMLRTGRVAVDPETLVALVMAALALIVVIAVIVRLARRAAGKSGAAPASPQRSAGERHSHDRLSGYSAGRETADGHWKKQLDSFLEAGLIDKAEYRVLLERRRNDGSR